MGLTPEAKITKQIIDYLKSLKREGHRIWWLKLHGGPMQRAGVPDLEVIFHGRHLFFEIKAPGKKPTQLQQIQIDRINEAGGEARVVHSVKRVEAILMGKTT